MAYSSKERVDHHQKLTDRLIQKMEEAVKYQKPWFECEEAPFNPTTGTKYRGVNFVSLADRGFSDPRFYTFNNVKSLAEETEKTLHVRKGEVGTPVFKAVQVELKGKEGADGQKMVDENGEPVKIWVLAYSATVFNGSQIEGLGPYQARERSAFEKQQAAEEVIEAMQQKGGVTLHHHTDGRAYYVPGRDAVYLPHPEQFKSDELYYRTALHEFGHATGHSLRLDRDQSGGFGKESYAKEELVAELSSYFLGAELSLPYDPTTHENHAAYLKSWIAALKNDKKFIFHAAAAATKAVEYQLERRDEYVKDREVEKSLKKLGLGRPAVAPHVERRMERSL